MSIENDADLGREPEGTIALPHLTTEFFIWLWYASEREGGTMMLPDNTGEKRGDAGARRRQRGAQVYG